MHPRVEALAPPDPDYRRFLNTLARRNHDRVPALELAVDPRVVAELLHDDARAAAQPGSADAARDAVRLLHRLGYDVVKVSARIPFELSLLRGRDASRLSDSERDWQNAHTGCIGDLADAERYAWPRVADIDFSPLEVAARALPEGMRLVGFCGGVLEYATYLVGLERFMLALYDAPQLARAVVDRVGAVLLAAFEQYAQMDAVVALWLGDDLGSKGGLLVSPDFLVQHIFPWYTRFAELAHAHGKPFILHSCGRVDAVMPALVHDVGIDAKHSFEDTIVPVEAFAADWADHIAVLGGVDVNLLTQGSELAIANRVQAILTALAPSGAYACGSGNSIPSYVPAQNYLAMLEELARFNAAC
jgi:uroporphyrinogen decarboxylase